MFLFGGLLFLAGHYLYKNKKKLAGFKEVLDYLYEQLENIKEGQEEHV